LKGKKIGMVYDLRGDYLSEGYTEEQVAEFDFDATISAIEEALAEIGFRPERIGHGRNLVKRLVQGDRWDLIFNIAEGLKGRSREAQVPALLEMYGIPYTFSDPLVCAVTLDKAVAKRLVRDSGLNTPEFHVANDISDLDKIKIDYPLFVKPVAEGTGKGISQNSMVENKDRLIMVCRELLEHFDQPLIVEEYLPGREFTVGVLGCGRHARVIGTMEVEMLPSAGGMIYSYETKEKCDDLVRYSRPGGREKDEVEKLALDSYMALECRDAGRVDIRMDARGKPAFMEINPLPGLHPSHSDLPMIATQEGMAYRDLIGAIVESAAGRAGIV